jgi:hypothetical protein
MAAPAAAPSAPPDNALSLVDVPHPATATIEAIQRAIPIDFVSIVLSSFQQTQNRMTHTHS